MFPKRGAVAGFLTTIALVLVLNFKTPEVLPPPDTGGLEADASSGPTLVAVLDATADGSARPVDPEATDTTEPDASTATVEPSASAAIDSTPPTPGRTPPVVRPSGAPVSPTHTPPARPPAPGRTPAPVPTPTPGRTPPPPAPTPRPTPTPAPTAFSGTINGAVARTEYGPVQVQVRFSAGKIVDVVALQTPSSDSRSRQIAARAVPILRSEALAAQSARIDTVSGATYTSRGYISSLQSAIDKARV